MKRLLPTMVLTFTAVASCGLDLAGLPGTGGGAATTAVSVTASASSSSSGTGSDGPTWTRRRKLDLDSGQITKLNNFPVLVRLTNSRIDYKQTQNNGQDLRFTDAQGAVIPHEIERWDESGTSLVWVRVPALTKTEGTLTTIWMYYGNVGAPDGQQATTVWSNGYRGVWHLAENGDSLIDSSGTTTNAENHGSTQSDGILGKGRSFSAPGNQYIDTLNSTDLTEFTIEVWVRSGKEPSKGGGPNGPLMREKNYQVNWDDSDPFSGTVSFMVPSPQDWIASDLKPLSADTWYYLAATYDGLKLRSYKNGMKQNNEVTAGTPLPGSDSAKIGWHAYDTEAKNFFDGDIDEVRIAQGSHSDSWIAAQYKSMTDNGLVTFGPEETSGPWPLP